jgi:hypothetical protein
MVNGAPAANTGHLMHDLPLKIAFVGSFLLGWLVWPNAGGLSDFCALTAMAGATSYFIREIISSSSF